MKFKAFFLYFDYALLLRLPQKKPRSPGGFSGVFFEGACDGLGKIPVNDES